MQSITSFVKTSLRQILAALSGYDGDWHRQGGWEGDNGEAGEALPAFPTQFCSYGGI